MKVQNMPRRTDKQNVSVLVFVLIFLYQLVSISIRALVSSQKNPTRRLLVIAQRCSVPTI